MSKATQTPEITPFAPIERNALEAVLDIQRSLSLFTVLGYAIDHFQHSPIADNVGAYCEFMEDIINVVHQIEHTADEAHRHISNVYNLYRGEFAKKA
jgi:hypothetical protein